jgi:hypothetical protein
MSDTYDSSSLIPIKRISFLQKWMLRLMIPIYLPKAIINCHTTKVDRNPLHDGKRNLSGEKIASCSSEFVFKEIKETAKKLKVTINDLVTACLSSAIK